VPGKDGGSQANRYTDAIYMLPQSNALGFSYVLVGTDVIPPSQNRYLFSDQVQTVTQICPDGSKVVTGNCKWDLFSFTSTLSWCRALDYPVGASGCSNCITFVTTSQQFFNGDLTDVITSVVYNNGTQTDTLFFNDQSCQILTITSLDTLQLKTCGFFCFFHQIDPIFDGDNSFTCRYIPASAFGVDLFNGGHSNSFYLHDKIQIITNDIVCSN